MSDQQGLAGPRDADDQALFTLAGLMAAIGLAFAAWPLIDSMNPSAEVRNPTTWVELATIPAGERRTVSWKRIPITIVHRTPEQIAAVRADDDAPMKFPEADRDRVQRDEWLVVIPICWLGSLPKGEFTGKWGGWFCPYADAYDLSGRLRTNWGRANFAVPPYTIHDNRWLVIGEDP